MAKQRGLHKIAGKVGEVSYYQSQNGGYLMRHINQGMSERVKTAEEFANTRNNAAEFGAAGKLAGNIIRPVSQRWRYILNPIATGLMAKAINELIKLDTTNPWGQRQLQIGNMESVMDMYNQMGKNQVPDEFQILRGNITFDSDRREVDINVDVLVSADLASVMKSAGSDGFVTEVYSMTCGNPTYNPATGKYVTPDRVSSMVPMTEFASDAEWAAGENLIAPATHTFPARGYVIPQNTANHLGGVLIILKPYKVVSNVKYTLQELCSAVWLPVVDAEE